MKQVKRESQYPRNQKLLLKSWTGQSVHGDS